MHCDRDTINDTSKKPNSPICVNPTHSGAALSDGWVKIDMVWYVLAAVWLLAWIACA